MAFIKLTRDEAIKLMEEYIKNENLRKHCLAVGAILKEFAKDFDADPELWEKVGILHDLDYEMINGDPQLHTLKTVEILEDKIDEEVKNAILAHNHKVPLKTPLDYILYAADPASGFIIAVALVMPDKKLSSVKLKSIKKKFKDKAFARGANRENMKKVEEIGINLWDFMDRSLKALQNISDILGL